MLASSLELSFWGGADPRTGEVIDRHHPLSGVFLQGRVLAIPSGRGPCSGSGVLLELLLNGNGPAAIVFEKRDDILTLGVMVAEELFGKAIPVLTVEVAGFRRILDYDGCEVYIDGGEIRSCQNQPGSGCVPCLEPVPDDIALSLFDQDLIDVVYREAARASMPIVLRMTALLGAKDLMDTSQAHIDACIYTGPEVGTASQHR